MSKEVKYVVKIFKINKKSRRGFYFTEKVVDEFLESPECRNRLKKKNSLGIITHKERYENPENKGKLSSYDEALYNKSYTHYISRFFKENGYFCAELTILDPDLFEGKPKENISFIRGLILSGVHLDISAGIEADYDQITKEGKKIFDIIGVDFTMSPDFIV